MSKWPHYACEGDAQEFRYLLALRAAFSGSSSSISNLANLYNQGAHFGVYKMTDLKMCVGWVNGSVANVFVATHDSERVNITPTSRILSSKRFVIGRDVFDLCE